MVFAKSAARLWKQLAPDERRLAAAAFWREPPETSAASALAAIIKARHLRPQVARSLPVETRTGMLASLLDPGESLAAALLVALHLGERRGLLVAFLDASGLAHEEGVLKDDDPPSPLSELAARAGIQALVAQFPPQQVAAYLNSLWLQDPDRWRVLEGLAQELQG